MKVGLKKTGGRVWCTAAPLHPTSQKAPAVRQGMQPVKVRRKLMASSVSIALLTPSGYDKISTYLSTYDYDHCFLHGLPAKPGALSR